MAIELYHLSLVMSISSDYFSRLTLTAKTPLSSPATKQLNMSNAVKGFIAKDPLISENIKYDTSEKNKPIIQPLKSPFCPDFRAINEPKNMLKIFKNIFTIPTTLVDRLAYLTITAKIITAKSEIITEKSTPKNISKKSLFVIFIDIRSTSLR